LEVKKMKLKFMSPDDIMTIIVALIIFGVGIFAVMTVIQSVPVVVPHGNTTGAGSHTNLATTGLQNASYQAIRNSSFVSNNVFNIVGVVLIVGAIMAIVGIVYSYIRPRGPTF
jgi:hypothetical protein